MSCELSPHEEERKCREEEEDMKIAHRIVFIILCDFYFSLSENFSSLGIYNYII